MLSASQWHSSDIVMGSLLKTLTIVPFESCILGLRTVTT